MMHARSFHWMNRPKTASDGTETAFASRKTSKEYS